ncbi:MAG: hypothetical protein NXI24_19895 [bacterium]|nr:hypothetical protein [bacterium]
MPFSFSGAAGGVLLLAVLLTLPAALFVRPLAALAALVAVTFLTGLLLLAGNYFWPFAGAFVLTGTLLAWRRGRFAALALADARASEAGVSGNSTEAGAKLTGRRALIALPILIALVGGWLFVFLPELSRVVPILPADSPADVFSWERIVQDLQTNRAAPLFAAPWLALMVWGVFRAGDSGT